MEGTISVAMHHGGAFVGNPLRAYEGGEIQITPDMDVDYLSVPHMEKTVLSMGYMNLKNLWYLIPRCEFSKGIRILQTDQDVMHMVSSIQPQDKVLHIYVEHGIDDVSQVMDHLLTDIQFDEGDDQVNTDFAKEVDEDKGENMEEPTIIDDEGGHLGEDDGQNSGEDDDEGVNLGEDDGENSGEENPNFFHKEDEDTYSGDDEGGQDGDMGDEILFGVDVGEMEESTEEDSSVEVGEVEESISGDSTEVESQDSGHNSVDSSEESENDFLGGLFHPEQPHSDYCDSSNPPSPCHSDGGYAKPVEHRYSQYREPENLKDIQFEVGQRFKDAHDAKKALRNYAIAGGYDIKFVRNARRRITANCVIGCEWYFHGSWMQREHTFQCKVYKATHSCVRTFANRQLTSSWLARRYLQKWRDNPDWSYKDIRLQVKDDFSVRISKSKAYRAKTLALDLIFGKQSKQFNKIWDYTHMLLKCNAGSTVKLLTESTSVPGSLPIFQRLYICFDACKKGFIAGCRPFVGVDGCFLKGPSEGQLLVAIGRDGNDQMFPIAFAVVEGETKESWDWFFRLLLEDIGQERRITFMSDQQKGLIPALHEMLPDVEHRFCWRHLYSNVSKRHRGKHLRDEMWLAAKATTVPDWKKHMKKIKAINSAAHDELSKLDPATWTRSAFCTYSKCNSLLNNMAESFNAFIIDCRDKPVITCLEMIRESLMARMQEKIEELKSYRGKICPNIQKKIEESKVKSGRCEPMWAGDDLFEVKHLSDKYIVNLAASSCTCRRWDLTGIPCHHAIAAIFYKKETVEDYVSHWYTVDTYKRIYECMILPVPSVKFWDDSGLGKVAPPNRKRQPGRPKKLRRRDPEERVPGFKLSKLDTKIKCSKCKRYGHNKSTCKAPAQPPVTVRKSQKLPVRKKRTSGAAENVAPKRQNVGSTVGPSGGHVGSAPATLRSSRSGVNASAAKSTPSFVRPSSQPVPNIRGVYQNPTRWYEGYMNSASNQMSKGGGESSGSKSNTQP